MQRSPRTRIARDTLDLGREDIAGYIERILAFEPDFLGFSIKHLPHR
jgi:hypothetical protein